MQGCHQSSIYKNAISGKYNKVKCSKRYALFQCFLFHISGVSMYTFVWLRNPEVIWTASSCSPLYPIYLSILLIVFPKLHKVITIFPVAITVILA